jgi:hypothetical protein
MEEQKL